MNKSSQAKPMQNAKSTQAKGGLHASSFHTLKEAPSALAAGAFLLRTRCSPFHPFDLGQEFTHYLQESLGFFDVSQVLALWCTDANHLMYTMTLAD
jgi:hypothetical protein